ncbi:AAA family ATPase [Clostridium thermopalmarium]|uniref:Nuclease SbcCD subunit C n=1 Tax=Clostridium thermopalmarium DSM 5974 TaxID=1121340 RepID=A0A2T0AN74_9CLOT|nr:AAA family ATPase [Clostridium thermopalmarium]PRR70317.1 chromosome segregation protein [Clostridium thermopalmarium DSM 5974]PVZ20853.1 DNA sulfur modification protein DndD [Clostridium thermopalmarium DSM 5974]
MKFKKIILKDFFRFYGKQEIDLSVDNNKTVVVLIGENGRGKTTILSAFNFVLYGKLLEPLIEDNMLNYKKRAELGKNLSTEASVELLFEEAKTNYIMKRYIDFKKDEDGNIVKLSSKPKACVYRVRENGDIEELDLKMFENRILIPENLSSFFFFDGERINRLAKVDGKAEIKKAILNILGISNIDNAKSDLSKVKKILINESKKIF